MIGRLRGTLVSRQPPSLLIEVGGIGYEVEAPMSTIYDLPGIGKEVILLTHHAVKEDSVTLYGFLSEGERALFRNLLKVSGIGAKIALAVLSGVSTDHFARLVHAGDVVALTRIPGIGKKTAERIVVELRDRLDGVSTVAGVSLSGSGVAVPLDAAGEATVALQQLGYKPAEVSRLVQKVAAEGDTAEAIIRKALRAALGS
ncbi:MAG TPA: Holliday junction branch migration protein RuvA [Rhodanobacter sp.]|nr:Holliday junction branch migration protein RuvA [Rhodanobacter sp.]